MVSRMTAGEVPRTWWDSVEFIRVHIIFYGPEDKFDAKLVQEMLDNQGLKPNFYSQSAIEGLAKKIIKKKEANRFLKN